MANKKGSLAERINFGGSSKKKTKKKGKKKSKTLIQKIASKLGF